MSASWLLISRAMWEERRKPICEKLKAKGGREETEDREGKVNIKWKDENESKS